MSSFKSENEMQDLGDALKVLLDKKTPLSELVPKLERWVRHVSGGKGSGNAATATDAYLVAIGERLLPRLIDALKETNDFQSKEFRLIDELLRGLPAQRKQEELKLDQSNLKALLNDVAETVRRILRGAGDNRTQMEEAHFRFDSAITGSWCGAPDHDILFAKQLAPVQLDLRSRRRATFCEGVDDKHPWIRFRIKPELTGKSKC